MTSKSYTCKVCGVTTRETGSCESGVGTCLACYDQAGLENEHMDGYHERSVADCPLCPKTDLQALSQTLTQIRRQLADHPQCAGSHDLWNATASLTTAIKDIGLARWCNEATR